MFAEYLLYRLLELLNWCIRYADRLQMLKLFG